MLGEAFDVSRQAKKVVNASLAFLRTVFWLSVKFTVIGRFSSVLCRQIFAHKVDVVAAHCPTKKLAR